MIRKKKISNLFMNLVNYKDLDLRSQGMRISTDQVTKNIEKRIKCRKKNLETNLALVLK
jgi:hypothetical protein